MFALFSSVLRRLRLDGVRAPRQCTVWTDECGDVKERNCYPDTLTGYHCDKIIGKISMNPDGSFPAGSYMRRWGPKDVDEAFLAWMQGTNPQRAETTVRHETNERS